MSYQNSRALAAAAVLCIPLAAPRAAAQTDYYNTDAGRPITVEDASPVEFRAVELQLAPLRLERARGGAHAWGIEPGVAVGVLPRTHVELGFQVALGDHAGGDHAAGGHATGLVGVELSALHALNVETSIPALAVAAELLVPMGALAPDRAFPSVKAIATKTFPWARLHANAQYTAGAALAADAGGGHAARELSRWMGGVAVDRAFPLRSLLLTAELVARRPLVRDAGVAWDTAAGARYQLSPRVAVDGGAGYRLNGDQGWFVTSGAAVAVGLPWRP